MPGTVGDLDVPLEYFLTTKDDEWCENAYGLSYLRNGASSRKEYCEEGSSSGLTCFHNQICPECDDNFCVARNVAFDVNAEKHFSLDCKLKDWGDKIDAPTNIINFRKYMFETGPKETFRSFIKNITHPAQGQLEAAKKSCASHQRKKEYTILFKRDGTNEKGSHPWHGLMELFSLYLTIDILRSGSNPEFGEVDFDNTQVVLLDPFPDGLFYSLWGMFAKKPIIHLSEFTKQIASGEKCLDNVILPLPGAANPMWKGDWRPKPCTHSALLDTWVNRLTDHYNVSTTTRAPDAPVTVTFIDRPKRRRLHDQDALLESLRRRFPTVEIRALNMRDMDMRQRIQVAAETDVLVGVHGSGLTFSMFQPKGSSVVEIQPEGFKHFGFRNLANLRQQRYFRAHASLDRGMNWQKTVEVTLEERRFELLMESAVQSVLHRGVVHSDVI
ncbi:glycosyltransferase family 61 protein [Patellaria atrata CBS 101060]|uniref:EGF domain-specific O-linked N-acetylglucosamine transferase n=1 Tax=Patellaria atrata CBS 101060 TaxID=1346257 RepID=A0A9P4SHF3_9PEZI|nr:glycosyltransferase family 61 protein [Patellaria atrata CBS 101060]